MRIALLCFLFLFSSCAYLEKFQQPFQEVTGAGCPAGDWFEVGKNDGEKGLLISQMAEYQNACKSVDYKPDFEAYKTGRQAGLKTYCGEQSGLSLGLKNAPYRNTCPTELEPTFLRQYNKGRKISNLKLKQKGLLEEIRKVKEIIVEGELDQEQAELLRGRLNKLQSQSNEIDKRVLYYQQL